MRPLPTRRYRPLAEGTMAQTQRRPGVTPQPDGMWQYTVHRVEINKMEGYARDMNDLGVQGWELVNALPLSLHRAAGGGAFHDAGNTNAVMMIWKRRLDHADQ